MTYLTGRGSRCRLLLGTIESRRGRSHYSLTINVQGADGFMNDIIKINASAYTIQHLFFKK